MLYLVNDIYDVAKFVLHGTSVGPTTVKLTTTTLTSSTPAIKSEDIFLLIESLVKLVQTLTAAVTGGVMKQNGIMNRNLSRFCHYCGEARAIIRTCKHVKEDRKSSKCICNAARKVVILNDMFIPHTISGITIHNRVYEWHRWNQTPVTASVSVVNLFKVSSEKASSFSLRAEDRIEALEQELFNLK
ncbi:uncharacterized protein LAESUDRAFT_667990 [Laetiporus sulphureus 93-53]|uniref:Uncharacterized protein n=1 Tax=Laetiporus sulphureus 93-53 TaxID=1314785 RepID=A0A165AQ40_9APHY|nr:uncharacterized protein LAESUDRAFT_667990 [Laetiporus sulphureus 93-53]KZS99435.1 hypothetical protein LAESUDRAFT_667990 [Laetiporus sulphureus 93-53]